MISTEKRPWWKLSWPAGLAGLVMLGALAVKNLMNNKNEILDIMSPGKLWKYGWPSIWFEQFVNPRGLWPGYTKVSVIGLTFDVVVAVALVVGSIHMLKTVTCRITIRCILAWTAATGACLAVFLQGPDSLWEMVVSLATGVLFVGIFLTCLAVIDWIGWGWSVVARMKKAN